jgi:streptomycin 3"-adenylyltransferase
VTDAPLLSPEIEIYLETLADRTISVLGDKVVGTYLHGSAVLGGFNPRRSDLDVLVVVKAKLSADEKRVLGDELSSRSLPVPAETLELSVVTLDSVRHPTGAPQYELHINTRDEKAADGRGKTDPDLILHFPIARQSGRLLGAGLPPAQVFAPVPRDLVLAGMIEELRDAVEGEIAAPEYLILNACRNLAYASDGIFYSKIGGGEWVLSHLPDLEAALISVAIQRQTGDGATEPDLDRRAAARMALHMADRLRHGPG